MPVSRKTISAALVLVAVFATVAWAGDRKAAKDQVDFGIKVASQGLWREAVYRWERAVELDPTYPAAFNNLAIAYEAQGQFEKAKDAYEKAIALDPKNQFIRQNFDLFKEINDRANRQDSKSSLKVIDADVLPLQALAEKDAPPPSPPPAGADPNAAPEPVFKDEKELELANSVFTNTEYWKNVGEEYQGPLIVTGTVLFLPHARSGYVQREQEVYDSFGRRSVVPVRTYMERKGFILRPKFIFIDGRTGETVYSETFREEVLYNAQQTTPALSSYFELMDRLLPAFLTTLSPQRIKGSRVLLR